MSTAPSVLLLTDSDVFAGTERHMLELATGLISLGHSVSIGCPVPGVLAELAAQASVRVIDIPKGRTPDLPAVRTLKHLLRAGEIDIIHGHNGRSALSATLAVAMARRGAAVSTQHFLDPNHVHAHVAKRLFSHFCHRMLSRRIRGHVAISNAVAASAVARGEVQADRVCVIHNGISDVEAATPDDSRRIRAALSLASETPLILCPARLETEKDIPTLIDSMQAVHRCNPAAVCLVAGEGTQRPALESHIKRLSLQGIVHLLGFRSDVLSLMRAADLVVLPSLAEPFGLILLEAMALRKPTIATSTGGPPEIVEDTITGLLVPPRDPAAFARAIQYILANPTLRHKMGAAARARYLQAFTHHVMAEKTSALYRRIVTPTPATFHSEDTAVAKPA